MADVANELAAKGYIHSVLAPISAIELAIMPFEVPTSVVLFYPLVPLQYAEEVQSHRHSIFFPKILPAVRWNSNLYTPLKRTKRW